MAGGEDGDRTDPGPILRMRESLGSGVHDRTGAAGINVQTAADAIGDEQVVGVHPGVDHLLAAVRCDLEDGGNGPVVRKAEVGLRAVIEHHAGGRDRRLRRDLHLHSRAEGHAPRAGAQPADGGLACRRLDAPA